MAAASAWPLHGGQQQQGLRAPTGRPPHSCCCRRSWRQHRFQAPTQGLAATARGMDALLWGATRGVLAATGAAVALAAAGCALAPGRGLPRSPAAGAGGVGGGGEEAEEAARQAAAAARPATAAGAAADSGRRAAAGSPMAAAACTPAACRTAAASRRRCCHREVRRPPHSRLQAGGDGARRPPSRSWRAAGWWRAPAPAAAGVVWRQRPVAQRRMVLVVLRVGLVHAQRLHQGWLHQLGPAPGEGQGWGTDLRAGLSPPVPAQQEAGTGCSARPVGWVLPVSRRVFIFMQCAGTIWGPAPWVIDYPGCTYREDCHELRKLVMVTVPCVRAPS